MEAVSYPIRIPKNVIELANLRTKEKHGDKSTAIRQFLYMGARDYVLEMYQKGRISLSRAAELMDTSTFEILRLAKELKIHTGATEEQQKKVEKQQEILCYKRIMSRTSKPDKNPSNNMTIRERSDATTLPSVS